MYDFILKNGNVIDVKNEKIDQVDIAVKDGKIAGVGYFSGENEIDCTGKYIAPEAKHLTKRVEEIHEGAYDDLIEKIMQKPITEMQELYNSREIEK